MTPAARFTYTGQMSRPLRTFLFLLPVLPVVFTGCSTVYTRRYSPAKSYYTAPEEKKITKEEADKLLGPAGTQAGGMPPGTPPGELPPAPLMQPAGEMPAADPLNLPPAAEPVPGAAPGAAPTALPPP